MTSYIVEITFAETTNLISQTKTINISVDHYGEYTPFQDIEHQIDDVLFNTGFDCYPSRSISWIALINGEKVAFKCISGKQRYTTYNQFINAYLVLCENFKENYDSIMKMRTNYPEFVPSL